jgi:spoIIIJ-associated protein
VTVGEGPSGLVATVEGDELGLLIGKHGHTIDAVQYLVNAIVLRGTQDATPIVVDAQDYRRRREAVLRDTAERAAAEAMTSDAPVSLEPMSSAERKIVHMVLQDHASVTTESDGREPQRCVVIRPRTDDA